MAPQCAKIAQYCLTCSMGCECTWEHGHRIRMYLLVISFSSLVDRSCSARASIAMYRPFWQVTPSMRRPPELSGWALTAKAPVGNMLEDFRQGTAGAFKPGATRIYLTLTAKAPGGNMLQDFRQEVQNTKTHNQPSHPPPTS